MIYDGAVHIRALSMDHTDERRLKPNIGHYDPTTMRVIMQHSRKWAE